MSIPGEFRAEFEGAPTVRCWVSFAGAPPKQIPFLIDTGATRTTLSPSHANVVFPGYAKLDWRRDPRLSGVRGIGGTSRIIRRMCAIRFTDDRVGPVYWDGPVDLIEPTADGWALPSLLGRDILDNFRLTVSKQESLISLEIQLPASSG